jgi:hypothetical protein
MGSDFREALRMAPVYRPGRERKAEGKKGERPEGAGLTWPSTPGWGVDRFAAIQAAIDAAPLTEVVTIVVVPGVYAENVVFRGRLVVVTSTDPDDPGIVASTIIDGRSTWRVVSFSDGEALWPMSAPIARRGARFLFVISCPGRSLAL